MAIAETLPNTSPFTNYFGMATKLIAPSIVPAESPTELSCDYVITPYSELVFAHPDGLWYKNDKNEFLFRKIIAADTIAIELWKDDEKIEDLDDNDFGTFYSSF